MPGVLREAASPDKTDASPQSERQRLDELMQVFCHGPLLHAIQTHDLFADSKHFVDMPVKADSSAAKILSEFQALTSASGWQKTTVNDRKALLLAFLNKHFDPPGSDMIPTVPFDFQEATFPTPIANIRDPEWRDWAFGLHKLWKVLGRMPDTRVESSFLHSNSVGASVSLRGAQNLVVVPGGRFRESYYWDTYWIVHGLLVSDMKHTARGVVNNLLEYVSEFGFVPNGGRIYYLTRSQPPMLSDMVRLVAQELVETPDVLAEEAEQEYDLEYLTKVVPILEREYSFWMQTGPFGHAVEIQSNQSEEAHVLNRYVSQANAPRPESYREDVSDAEEAFGEGENNAALQVNFYNEMIAAAESGWDFTSRWLGDYKSLKTARTSKVVPVELNSIMYRFEMNMVHFHKLLKNPSGVSFFEDAAAKRRQAMDTLLWSDEAHAWKDYLLDTHDHSPVVSVSDYTPLWAGAFDANDTDKLDKIVESFRQSGLILPGGVQSTSRMTKQQWDAPNAWPPEQDIVIEGLLAANTDKSKDLAVELLQTWVDSGFIAWQETGAMFEKYNATEMGGIGHGGEYEVQLGFGWTNGVILKFLTKYQNLLTPENSDTEA